MSVSPVIAGLALVLVYGSTGWSGSALDSLAIQVIYATPGMILATCFVALPLVVRELVPVLEEIGLDQEQAARSLGAGPIQRFRRITLRAIKWALASGNILATAGAGTHEATVERLQRVGFEVRANLRRNEELTHVLLTRDHVESLALSEGSTVWVREADAPVPAGR